MTTNRRRIPAWLATLALLALAAASGGPAAHATTTAYVPPAPDFRDVARASGLDFTCQHWDKTLGLNPRWFPDILFCASPVLADFNGDGYTDIFFPNTRYTNRTLNAERDPQDALFLNNGDGTFTDATSFVGWNDSGYSFGAAPIDFDNSGRLSIYVANYPESPAGFNGIASPSTTFYVNHGDGTFTSRVPPGLVTQPLFGSPDRQMGMAVAVCDYDRDGRLDIYRGNYIRYDMRRGMPASLQLTDPDTNELYHNEGDGTFTDATIASGASLTPGRTFGAVCADFNEDGWPDLYVANDENPNELYLNHHDGTFTDASAGSGANDPRGNMCVEAADFTNDGHLDLFMSAYENELKGYYVGHGDGTFDERSTLGDLPQTASLLGWGCVAADVDNDGARDLFVANGHMLPTGGEFPGGDDGYELPNVLFRNTLRDTGVQSWSNVSAHAGPGLLDRYVTSGAAAADLDFDGNVEIVAVNNNAVPVSLYKNFAVGQGHWLDVDLAADPAHGNLFAIGAKVVVTAGDLTSTAWRITGESLGSGSVVPLHFGLGGSRDPVSVTVTWPDGVVETRTAPIDTVVRIDEGRGVALDTLAPRVDVHVDGTAGANGWWTSPSVNVTLSAEDRGLSERSGVADLSYRVADGPITPYAGPFTVSGEGAHRLTLYASDRAGNHAWYPTWVKIDSIAPALALTHPLAGMLYAQDRALAPSPTGETVLVMPVETPSDLARTADDEVQGARTEAADKGFPLPPAPASIAALLDGSAGSDGHTRLAANASDATSGIERVEFRVDGALAWTRTQAPYEWRADLRGLPLGEHVLALTAFDRAGLSETRDVRVIVAPTAQDGILDTLLLGPSLGGE